MTKILTAALALTLLGGSAAVATAQPAASHGQFFPPSAAPYHAGQSQDSARTADRAHPRAWRATSPQADAASHHGRYQMAQYARPQGYSARGWERGARLPAAYRTRSYVIGQPHMYGLRHVRYGENWVRVNNDALRIGRDGRVAEVAPNLFYQ